MTLTSPSFPTGAQTDRSELQARSERKLSQFDVIARGAAATVADDPRPLRTNTLPCPHCHSAAPLPTIDRLWYSVACTSDGCGYCAEGDTPSEVLANWDAGVTV